MPNYFAQLSLVAIDPHCAMFSNSSKC